MGCTSAKSKRKHATLKQRLSSLREEASIQEYAENEPGSVDISDLDLDIDVDHLRFARCSNGNCVNYGECHSGSCTLKQLATSRLVLESSYFSQTVEKEGYESRTTTLYHATSLEVARLIANSGKMLRGKKGMFGGGIYFAESADIANHKARHRGALIEAQVTLGISLICTKTTRMSFSTLYKNHGCHSVKGVGCVSTTEYAVYNWSQVTVTKITVYVEGRFPNVNKPAMYWESQSNNRGTYAASRKIESTASWAVDYVTSASMTQLVLASRTAVRTSTYHQSQVQASSARNGSILSRAQTTKCSDMRCIKYNRVHFGSCTYRCEDIKCIKYNRVHFGSCTYRCSNPLCSRYNKVHFGSCGYR